MLCQVSLAQARPESYTTFFCSTQLNKECILLINVKRPTIVGILTFISMMKTASENLRDLKQVTSLFVGILVFMSI